MSAVPLTASNMSPIVTLRHGRSLLSSYWCQWSIANAQMVESINFSSRLKYFRKHSDFAPSVRIIFASVGGDDDDDDNNNNNNNSNYPEGKRPFGRLRCRWEDNIKMDLQEVGGGCGDWMELARIGTGGGHLWVRWGIFGFQKCGEFLD